MNVLIDEYGNPLLVFNGGVQDAKEKTRKKGKEAIKTNILAVSSIGKSLSSSFGPKGMDKILISPDGDVCVTNDGATILQKMDVQHNIAKLMVDLSCSQDSEAGDGTTGIVIFAAALLNEADKLINKNLHICRINEGFDIAANIALRTLEKIAFIGDIMKDDHALLKKAAVTALGSKVVSGCQLKLADVAVEAVLSVADLERRDVNWDMIKVIGKPSGKLSDTHVLQGVCIDKEFSHSQMTKCVKCARIAILTCAFEPPKPKTKHHIDITTPESYQVLLDGEQEYFREMIRYLKDVKCNLVVCQWGFDDEANHLLMSEGISAIRWVGGVEIELIAVATGGKIISRFQDITEDKLGFADVVEEISYGTQNEKLILINECRKSRAVSVMVYAGNQMLIAEAERSMHDAMCCVRNLIRDPRVVPGGCGSELACCLAVDEASYNAKGVAQFGIGAFATALSTVAETLADNCGMDSIVIVNEVKRMQIESKNSNIGINCFDEEPCDMIENGIFETFQSKQNQVNLATQVVKMVLKIDDVISPGDMHEPM